MTITVNAEPSKLYQLEVRRDMRHLLTPESTAWLTQRSGDDFDESDSYRELDEC